jgi:hypothetical protein
LNPIFLVFVNTSYIDTSLFQLEIRSRLWSGAKTMAEMPSLGGSASSDCPLLILPPATNQPPDEVLSRGKIFCFGKSSFLLSVERV